MPSTGGWPHSRKGPRSRTTSPCWCWSAASRDRNNPVARVKAVKRAPAVKTARPLWQSVVLFVVLLAAALWFWRVALLDPILWGSRRVIQETFDFLPLANSGTGELIT